MKDRIFGRYVVISGEQDQRRSFCGKVGAGHVEDNMQESRLRMYKDFMLLIEESPKYTSKALRKDHNKGL